MTFIYISFQLITFDILGYSFITYIKGLYAFTLLLFSLRNHKPGPKLS